MTIWLGYPEEIGSSTNSNRDDIESLIEEIEAKDDEMNDLLDQLVGELIEIDKDFKLREKCEFIEEAELGSEIKKGSNKTSNASITVNEGSTWPEIISAFETHWDRIENDPRKPELTKKIQ
ncbi:MAG: hypothetical protein KAJ51_05760, partial [Thermoplasmata archaeon]|nr:hypothetical protein [Thermoplasmata archaeon]